MAADNSCNDSILLADRNNIGYICCSGLGKQSHDIDDACTYFDSICLSLHNNKDHRRNFCAHDMPQLFAELPRMLKLEVHRKLESYI